MTKLALPKFWFEIYSSVIKDPIIVLLEKAMDRPKLKADKAVVMFDGRMVDFAYVGLVLPIDNMNKDTVNTARERAKIQPWAFSAVALERLDSYEDKLGKMPLWKLQTRLENFMKQGKDPIYERFYKVYVSAGGDPDLIPDYNPPDEN